MSYILDALRRADSERERGTVPSLHANPVPADRAHEAFDGPRVPRWAWLLLAVGLLAIGAQVPKWLSPPESDRAPTVPVQLPKQRTEPTVVQLQPPEASLLEQAAAAASAMASRHRTVQVPPTEHQGVPGLNELPEEIRRALPKLVTGGAMYSESPSNRMLILNGQVFREGDIVADKLVLERIKLNQAVLSFKGQRFEISY